MIVRAVNTVAVPGSMRHARTEADDLLQDVAAAPPLTERELRLVLAFVRHQVRFLIVGLSAAALQSVLDGFLALQSARAGGTGT